jgi:hypothetical protein
MTLTPPPPLLELRHTRDFSPREKRDLTRVWQKLIWRDGVSRWYTMVTYLEYGFAGLLAVSVVMAVGQLADIAPSLSGRLAVAAVGYASAVAAARWVGARVYREKYWEGRGAGDYFAVTSDGFQAGSMRGRFECRWSQIETVIDGERHVIIKLPGNGALIIVKEACEGQDARAFSAELVRRWQHHRAPSIPAVLS